MWYNHVSMGTLMNVLTGIGIVVGIVNGWSAFVRSVRRMFRRVFRRRHAAASTADMHDDKFDRASVRRRDSFLSL